MKVSDVTSVARAIDVRYPTNQAIVILALVVAGVGTTWRLIVGAALLEGAMWGIGAGFVLFLTWALSRELDPDHDLSAFVGAGLALIALLLFEKPPLMVVFWLLLVLRIVNRTTGLPARPLDSLAAFSLGGWLAWQGYWMVGLVTALAFLLDGLLSPPLRYHLFISGLTFLATVILSLFNGDIAMESGATLPVVVASAGMTGFYLVVIGTLRDVQTVGDRTDKTLNPRRVQAGQILALLAALLFAWWYGAAGMVALLPLWAAMLGTGLYRVGFLLLSRSR